MARGDNRAWWRFAVVVSNPWFKAIAFLLICVLVGVWLRDQMPFFRDGFRAIGDVDWIWVGIALAFSYLSMSSYGSVQKTLLNSAGVRVGYWDSLGLIFSANAFSMCIPGGQVFGATLTYRKTRQWGATRVVASWQLVVSGILATVGIVLLGMLGFFLVGQGSNPVLLVVSGLGLFGAIFVIQWAARHPERIEGASLKLLGWVNRKRKKPENAGAHRLRGVIDQAEAVDLTRWQLTKAFFWSLVNWVADIGCLWAAALAVGAEHSIGGIIIAYVTGKIVATAPVTPGGLGTVEIALITALTAGGMGADIAFATVFVYRIVSFLLVALAGWVIFWLFYRHVTDIDPDESGDGRDDSEETQDELDFETAETEREIAAAVDYWGLDTSEGLPPWLVGRKTWQSHGLGSRRE